MPHLVLPTSVTSPSVSCPAAVTTSSAIRPTGGRPARGRHRRRRLPGRATSLGWPPSCRPSGVSSLPADADDRIGQPAPRDPQSDRAPDQTDADDGHTTKQAHESAVISLVGSGNKTTVAGSERHGFLRQYRRPRRQRLERGIVTNREEAVLGGCGARFCFAYDQSKLQGAAKVLFCARGGQGVLGGERMFGILGPPRIAWRNWRHLRGE